MFITHRIALGKSKKTKNEKTTHTTPQEHITSAISGVWKDVSMEVLKRAALVGGGVIIAIKVVDILGEIAVKKTKSADNE